jgi:hypothetical protein
VDYLDNPERRRPGRPLDDTSAKNDGFWPASTSLGLNDYSHIHNAVVLSAINPTPAGYPFLEEVAGLDAEQVRAAFYHEGTYQAARRISLR